MTTEKFHWTSSSGVEITLPHMRNISAGLIRRTRGTDEINVMFTVIEETSDTEMLARVDSLTMGDLEELVEAWVKDVAPGESGSSLTS